MNKSKRVFLRVFWFAFILPLVTLIVLFVLISTGKLGYIPSFTELENPKYNLASELYSEDGKIIGKYYIQNRTFIDFDDISPRFIDALISTEDIRFYKHSGIDARGTARAIIKRGILGNEASGGGSTITQQLAKLLFHDPSRTVWKRIMQKLNEWVIAVKLERRYTKEEIITLYLNQVDFLYQAVGINSAAKVYFNTTADSLNWEQSAMLVGMLKNPALFNPLRRPDTTKYRRNVVLNQLHKYKRIPKETRDSLKALPLDLNFQKIDHNEGIARYFWEHVRNTLNADKPQRSQYFSYYNYRRDSIKWLEDPFYGWINKNFKPDGSKYNIYRDGLKIYSTINSKMQVYAEEAVREHLGDRLQIDFFREKEGRWRAPFSKELTENQIDQIMEQAMRWSERYRVLRSAGFSMDSIRENFNTPAEMTVFSWDGEKDTVLTPMDSIRYYKHFLRAGFMSMDPHTGHVKAYVGGPDFKHFKFDHVMANNRQIGSTIKPFLYTLAMQEGFSPCHEVPNVAVTFPEKDSTWTPKNSGSSKYEGKMVTLKWGLANSVNYISAWLIKQFNPQSVVDLTRKLGITSYIDPVNSIFLGTSGISVYEMVAAYSTYANKGVHIEPVLITHIEDKNGNLISNFYPKPTEAISEKTAFLMLNLMQGVVNGGTASRLRYTYEFEGEIAAKTGTTQNHSDGWFIGITPNLVSGLWVGAEDRSVHFDYITQGQGANMALPIWAIYMKKIYEDETLGIKADTVFLAPENFEMNLDCDDIDNISNEQYVPVEFNFDDR